MNQEHKQGKMQIFEWKMAYKHLPFLIFLAVLGVLYIANSHRAERKVRTIQKLQRDIERSKWEYFEAKSDVSFDGIQSQTEQRVEELGLKAEHRNIEIIVADDADQSKEE